MSISTTFVRLLTTTALGLAAPAFAQDAAPPAGPEATQPASPPDSATQRVAAQPTTTAPEAGQAAPAEAAADQGAAGTIGDIVVTANRTQSTAQKTPVALTVYSGDNLAAAGVTSVVNLQAVDPSINVTTSTGAAYVAIRGIASTDVTETGDPSVAIARDDFFTNRAFSIATSMYDLDRVEVLKGPQGTLFGRNSTGGLIHLITRQPGKTFGANGSVEVGDYSTLNVEAGVDVPVSDWLGFRLAGVRRYHKGYRKLDVIGGRGDDDDTWSGRATMVMRPLDGLKALVQYQHDDIDNAGDVALSLPLGRRPDGLSAKHFANYEPVFNRLKGDRIRWELSYDHLPGDLSLTYSGGFDRQHWRHQLDASSRDTATGAGIGRANFRQAENPDTWNHEVRIATPEDRMVTLQAGYFHFSEHNRNLDSGLIVREGPFNGQYLVHFLYDVRTKSDAGFGQLGFRPTETLRLTAGARYTWDSKVRNGASFLRCDVAGIPNFPVGTLPNGQPLFLYQTLGCNGTPPTITTATPAGGEKYKDSKPTFHVGADWNPTSRNMVYAKFDTGYKAGGFNSNGSAQPVPYGPETIRAWEIGTKNRFLDNHLLLNADVFLQNYNGYQASQSTSVISGSAQGIFNVGKARIKGLEAQLIYTSGGFRLDLNTTLLDTKFTFVTPPGITRGNGTTVTPAQIEGNHLPNAPGFVLTGGVEYRADLGALTVTPRLDGKFSSSYYYSVFNDADTKQHSYTTLNASLNLVPRNSPVELLLFVRNLTDKKVFANAAQNFVTQPNPIDTFEFQPPRTYGVRASFRF